MPEYIKKITLPLPGGKSAQLEVPYGPELLKLPNLKITTRMPDEEEVEPEAVYLVLGTAGLGAIIIRGEVVWALNTIEVNGQENLSWLRVNDQLVKSGRFNNGSRVYVPSPIWRIRHFDGISSITGNVFPGVSMDTFFMGGVKSSGSSGTKDLRNFPAPYPVSWKNAFYKTFGSEIILGEAVPTTMEQMFMYNGALVDLNLERLDLTRCVSAESAFAYCYRLRRIKTGVADPPEGKADLTGWYAKYGSDYPDLRIDVRNVQYMFRECKKLEEIKFGSGANGYWAHESCKGAFYNCTNLKRVDIGSWPTGLCTSFEGLFHGCENLETISTGGNLSLKSATGPRSLNDMFYRCTKLKDISSMICLRTNLDLSACSMLTPDSVKEIIYAATNHGWPLGDGDGQTRTLKFHPEIYATLTEADLAKLTAKGWSVISST